MYVHAKTDSAAEQQTALVSLALKKYSIDIKKKK